MTASKDSGLSTARAAKLVAALLGGAALAALGFVFSGPSERAPSPRAEPSPAQAASLSLPVVRARSSQERNVRSGERIAGTVTDASGSALSGVRVGASDERVGLATSDADGHFELTGFGSEPAAIYAVLEGYAPARLEGVAPGTRDVRLAMLAPARVEGELVVPSGAREVLVSLCRSLPETNKEQCVARRLFRPPADRYALERLAPGDYQIVAEPSARPPLRFPVRLGPGEVLEGPRLVWP